MLVLKYVKQKIHCAYKMVFLYLALRHKFEKSLTIQFFLRELIFTNSSQLKISRELIFAKQPKVREIRENYSPQKLLLLMYMICGCVVEATQACYTPRQFVERKQIDEIISKYSAHPSFQKVKREFSSEKKFELSYANAKDINEIMKSLNVNK